MVPFFIVSGSLGLFTQNIFPGKNLSIGSLVFVIESGDLKDYINKKMSSIFCCPHNGFLKN